MGARARAGAAARHDIATAGTTLDSVLGAVMAGTWP
jgi:hypothetical protein